jgi:hypothetical protein
MTVPRMLELPLELANIFSKEPRDGLVLCLSRCNISRISRVFLEPPDLSSSSGSDHPIDIEEVVEVIVAPCRGSSGPGTFIATSEGVKTNALETPSPHGGLGLAPWHLPEVSPPPMSATDSVSLIPIRPNASTMSAWLATGLPSEPSGPAGLT